jgi:hypothetical protein
MSTVFKYTEMHLQINEVYLKCIVPVVYWSEFLATDPEARVRFPALSDKKVVGLERGPLSLVSTTEELLDRKVAALV